MQRLFWHILHHRYHYLLLFYSEYFRLKLRRRNLVNVAGRDLSTTILGHKVRLPIGIAPVYHTCFYPQGEIATAKGTDYFVNFL